MASTIQDSGPPGLERTCGAGLRDWIRVAPTSSGVERMEAFFCGHGFDPHRHDTYGIGFTLEGVQSFRYLGAARFSTAGQMFVLHPDELHDGRAGTPGGFRYNILYIEPRLIQEALGGCGPLPFVRDAVSRDRRLAGAIGPALEDMDRALEDLQRDEIVLAIARALHAVDGSLPRRKPGPIHRRAVNEAREFLDAKVEGTVSSTELERATGLSRYSLARHFRACLGTSPYRYLVMRRLARARTLISRKEPLASVAVRCGFADQSHLTRQFKKTYGLTPGRWLTCIRYDQTMA